MKTCIVNSCNGKHKAKGYCGKHYRRLQRYGDPSIVISQKIKHSGCKIPKCDKQHRGRGYCTYHYRNFYKHGDPNKVIKERHGLRKTSEYSSWYNMKTRCLNSKTEYYKWYGAVGVSVCDRWLKSFKSFYQDMGPKPTAQHSLDRINPFGNYAPDNCRWATAKEQAINKRKNYTGHVFS